MKTIYEDEYIVVKETGRDYDFIATIENKTGSDVKIIFDDYDIESTEIKANEWIGLLADYYGREQLSELRNKKFIIELTMKPKI